MTFFALLLKEIRLRVRRERLIWLLVVYVLLLGLLEWITFSSTTANASVYSLNSAGSNIYTWLIILQFLLILFIAPAFTASTINAEKERQTYDLLLCSRLSSFSFVAGKLVAGLSNTLMLIAAAIPLFSLVFFFGGIDPLQVVMDQVMFIVTAIMVATFALFCSALFPRPAVSTAITYMGILLWLVGPLLLSALFASSYVYSPGTAGSAPSRFMTVPIILDQATSSVPQAGIPLPFLWHPLTALNHGMFSTVVPLVSYDTGVSAKSGITSTVALARGGGTSFKYLLWDGFAISSWLMYILLCILATVVFFLLSQWVVKPYPMARLRAWLKQVGKQKGAHHPPTEQKDTDAEKQEEKTVENTTLPVGENTV